MSFELEIKRELGLLAETGLLRRPRLVSSSQGPEITIDGRTVISLCSNNYLGIANHTSLVTAVAKASAEFGIGAAGSRHIQGTMTLHKLAQERLSRFVRAQSSLLFSSGYAANVGSISALAKSTDIVFSDAFNHASIIDGCRLSRAKIHIYRHLDVNHLYELLSDNRTRGIKALVVTEAVFSVDGDIAPLTELRKICDHFDAALVVDEAHSLGIFGPNGAGLCADQQVVPDVLIGTLGKAFGVIGAFVAGSTPVIDLVENLARSYIFSTATPPSLAAAAIASLDLVEQASDARKRLIERTTHLRRRLFEIGFLSMNTAPSQIIVLRIGDPRAVMKWCSDLLERGVFIHGIRPPTVPPGTSRLRITPMATHTDEQIERAVEAFRSVLSLSISNGPRSISPASYAPAGY